MNENNFYNESGINKELLKITIKNTVKKVFAKNAWRVLARHNNWVRGATITESINGDVRRFTATVDGWRNFFIYEGPPGSDVGVKVQTKVREIRDRIRAGDDKVFNEFTRVS